jgi:phosphoglycerate dehydrogenase-like enzyme
VFTLAPTGVVNEQPPTAEVTHRLFDAATALRAGSWVGSLQFGGDSPHDEVLGRTIGIIGYGRIGREVAEWAAGIKCRVLAANRC